MFHKEKCVSICNLVHTVFHYTHYEIQKQIRWEWKMMENNSWQLVNIC